jgi:hypothetical protein
MEEGRTFMIILGILEVDKLRYFPVNWKEKNYEF